jgi:indole-3-glycerol phosphate synthase
MRFLDRVVNEKKREIEDKRDKRSLRDLSRRAATTPVRDFRAALGGGRRIIAEVKRRSPRVPQFHGASRVDELAVIYEENGACAVSVVTDERNFGTSLRDAARLRSRVSVPILVKDFIIDPYQVHEAKAFGADAVLLIARILERDALRALLELTGDLGMRALVEVHVADEAELAYEIGARIIGVNNRDLDSLEVSLDTTRALAGRLPGDALIVSESGIRKRAEIDELSRLGVDAFLIGGALLQSADPGELLRDLLGRGEAPDAAKGGSS